MNYSFFLFKIISIILIVFSYKQEFNPIPKGNGELNDKYNHRGEENNLFFIFFTFRHGARSPLFLDNNTDILGGKWPKGGELTNYGRKQHYEIGLKNRERYSNFIRNEYLPRELKIFSTNFDRTINSVQSQLLGLYNNITYDNYNFSEFNNTSTGEDNFEQINSILPPVQLFQFEGKKYNKIFKNRFDCKYLHENILKNLNQKNEKLELIIKKFNEEYHDILMKEYKNLNIINISSIRDFDNFCDIYEAVYFDENNRHILNKIAKYGKNITEIKEICDNYLYYHYMYIRNGGYASNNGIISQSNTFKNILNWMKVRADQNNNFASQYSEPKFILYSGHDSTIFELQSFLKKAFNVDFEYAPFACEQLLELRRYNYVYYVELYYNDRLKMNITYDVFIKRINNIIMSDEKVYNICYRKKEEMFLEYGKKFLIVMTLILSVVMMALICKIYIPDYDEITNEKIIQIE